MATSSAVAVAEFHPDTHEVFVSFRGEDTRGNFTSHLFESLHKKQIKAYRDQEMNKGDEISSSLRKAIEDSYISVIIFSENYASSKWCLDELLIILDCRKRRGQCVIPVFYKVDPSNVRNLRGSYKEAFAKHEGNYSINRDKLTKWKEAIYESANLAGYDSRKYGEESELIEEIVKDVLKKMDYMYPQEETKCPFGFHENLAPIESSWFKECRAIGIWGMGGIGKTTIAKWLFEKYSCQYESSYFMANIREISGKGGQALCNELVSKLLDESTATTKSTFVKRRLNRKRVFVVLDDVSTLEQLEYLDEVLQCLGSSSRIVITTRDKHVLIKGNVDAIHEVKGLNFQESLQLFSLNAFNQLDPKTGFEDLSRRAIDYAKGLPLALKVLGSFLHSKNENEWESALRKLNKIPNGQIHGVLKLSYDGLDREEKEIFLDIACFFNGYYKEDVISIVDSYGWHAAIGLRTLQERALITITGWNNSVRMHDLIQEMGWEIVREESIKEPGERSRLWDPVEVYDVLKNNRGTKNVEGIILDMSQIRDLHISGDTFKKMMNIRILKFYLPSEFEYSKLHLSSHLQLSSDKLRYLQWDGFTSRSLPLTFCPEKLVELSMRDSQLEKLWDGVQDLANLKRVDLRGSKRLIELPDFSLSSNLEEVNLSECESLCCVHPSLLSLPSLVSLNVSSCITIKRLPASINQLPKLKYFDLRDCKRLDSLPELPQSIKEIYLSGSNIKCLPASINQLPKLKFLDLRDCKRLQSLPELPQSIEVINLRGSNIKCLSASINQFPKLKYLDLRDWKRLDSLPELPQSIEDINLSGSNIKCLPASIPKLKYLDLRDYKMLQSLPKLPQSIKEIDLSRSKLSVCLQASTNFQT